MDISKAFKNDRLCKALTGMTAQEINGLVPTFEVILISEAKSKKRIREVGGGRKGELPSALHKVFFILFYLKCYPTFDFASFVFSVHRSRPHDWVKNFMPILEKTLGRNLVLPTRQINNLADFLKHFPEAKELFVDGTERRVQRPKNSKNQKKLYSGKKKFHARKNIIVTTKRKEIAYLSPTTSGAKHDYNIAKNEEIPRFLPPDKATYLDNGFQGIKDLVKNPQQIFMPKKKPRNGELNSDEKETNTIIASIRIKAEHAIAGLKRFNCLAHIYRNKKGQDDGFIYLAAGLWNYHLRMVG